MRAQDIDLSKALEFRPSEGKLMLSGRRMLIMSQRSLGLMSELLAGCLGRTNAQAIFAQFGFRCGGDDYAALVPNGDWDGDGDRLASGPIMHMWEGIVHVEPTKVEFDLAKGTFHMMGIWKNSFEAENHLASFGPATDPVCASLAGYASGWGTAFFGKPVLAIETACVGKGDPHCAFEMRPETAWGAEADPWRSALSAREAQISRILEDLVASRARDLQELRRALDEHALVSVAGADGTIISANERFCAVSQFTRDELVGQNHRILNSGVHPRSFWADFWKTIRSGRVWRGEVCNRAKDGSLYWVAATVTPLPGPDGRPIQYIAIRTDITERKRAETELQEAKEAADRANRAKSDFLAMMSHEIRTPMNAVLGFANLLLDTSLTDEQRRFVSTISGSGQALMALINDILDFSKVEAGQLVLECIRYDLWTALSEVSELMSVKAREKGLQLVVERGADVPRLMLGDPGRVRQILLNLVSNAIKFTQQGRVVVRATMDEGGKILLVVEDTGIGIAPHVLPRLFRSFSQGETSTTRRFGGTGLGLAISKRLAEMMGGEIGVQSAIGQGSRFWFTLPPPSLALTLGVTADFGEEIPSGTADVPPVRHLAGSANPPIRALLAEDNSVNQVLARHLLTSLGCAVDIAGNGKEAIELWGRLPYDIVFMDCQMPEMDGLAATAEIRRRERESATESSGISRRHVSIVAITASATVEERAACTRAGMDDFVEKPIRKNELRRCLAELVRPQAIPHADP